ncbi:MAG: M20/M25/M40 family metallo-hydrolase [Clostridia bacterium]|nr:M20/M25/M40 family metallo-hydrolase [Clostridia bacterium]
MEKFKILKDLIKFNTIKDKENKEIIDYIENVLLEKGLKTEYKGKYLIMSTDKEAKLGFLGHTDTVEYIDGWDTNPFELTKKGNELYGLGTADMKGGIAAMMDAIIETDLSALKQGIKLYFTYDEEINFGGIYDIVKTNEKFPELMIFGEPTDNEILVGSKGLLEIDISFNGIKAHSSNPEKGKSANMNAVKFIYELNEFYNKNIKKDSNENYEVPYTTMNVGLMKGGSAKNSVPANCEISIDFRIIKNEHIILIKEKLKELSNKYDCIISIIEEIQPFLNQVEFTNKMKTANFLTEASKVENSTRIILGAGPVTAHEINEHITEESYKKLVEQYTDIIKKVCM